MFKNFNRINLLFVFLLCFQGSFLFAENTSSTALKDASLRGQYAFLVFYDTKGYASLVKQLEEFNSGASKKAMIYKVDTSDVSENSIITKYGVMRAKLPLVLVFAPNGVVTGGYEQTVPVEKLKESMNVSDLMLKILKPLQERKVALVTLQNDSTLNNAESWKAVSDFTSDPQYSSFSEAVKVDPRALGGNDFLKQCGIITPLTQSTVVILLPPGSIGKILSGKIVKADILAALQACTSSGGCGPASSGCGPQK